MKKQPGEFSLYDLIQLGVSSQQARLIASRRVATGEWVTRIGRDERNRPIRWYRVVAEEAP